MAIAECGREVFIDYGERSKDSMETKCVKTARARWRGGKWVGVRAGELF